MIWQLGDEHDGRVIKYDGWLDLNEIEAPEKQGVFVFVSEKVEVKYIGCSGESLSKEINNAVSKGKSVGASMFSWYTTDSESSSESLKAYWVNKYRPENNRAPGA